MMDNRVSALVFLVCMGFAIYVYDSYQVQNGRPSPIKRFMKYYGLVDKNDKPLKAVQAVTSPKDLKTYRFHAEKTWERWQEALKQLEKERLEELDQRREWLKDFVASVDELKEDMGRYAKTIDPQNSNDRAALDIFRQFMGLLEELREVYNDYLFETYADEDVLADAQKKVEIKFQSMMRQLIKVTPNDLKDMIYLYQEFEYLQRDLFAYVDRQQQAWHAARKAVVDRFRRTVEAMKSSDNPYWKRFEELVFRLDLEQEEVIKKLDWQEEAMRRMLVQRKLLDRSFLVDLCDIMKLDIKRLIEDPQYAVKCNHQYLSVRRRMEGQIVRDHKSAVQSQMEAYYKNKAALEQ